ncbi:MAG: Uma2 family endonuclease [Treponema sp.]|jgi:Uma2 family endonuclease|nr:Uma2 family endonuclease [Treponema sp.]
MGAAAKEERLFTCAGYKAWKPAEGECYEFIYGAAYAMPGLNTYHQSICGGLFRQIANYLYGKPCRVFSAPFDVRLFYEEDESDDTVVRPDISVICDEKKPGSEGCRGAPDPAAGILSPSNSVFKMERKSGLYRQAGVREYRAINPGFDIGPEAVFADGD